MADGGGIKTSIDPGIVQRAATGIRAAASKVVGFFTPVPPPAPVAPESKGRQYDYGMGVNLVSKPRSEERGNVSFEQLRQFADGYDLLRLVIETRKDQLCGLSWNIVGRETDSKIQSDDKRVLEVEKFLRRPDGFLDWGDWLRTLIEDLLVIDAPAVYLRKTVGGGAYSAEVIDGATIKLLINNDGRTPLAPEPAYAQIIKGMPASQYTTDELIYKPRNRRSWKLYGYSPVEQIIMTVNIALRRQITQLHYYTEGNIPEAFATCPPEWSATDVADMQKIWDSLMLGQAEAKRHMKFIPGGTDITFAREAELKNQFDEWLARIVCYAFSVSPQALIMMMNRATAETAAETAALEGLAPLQTWVKSFVDLLIEKQFGYDDLVFQWDDGEELDPKTQMEINVGYLGANVLDIEEVRKDIGRDPRGTETVEGAPPVLPEGATPPGQPAALVGAGAAGEDAAAAGGVPSTTPPQVDADGNPVPPQLDAAGNPIPTAVAPEAKVADTAMTGVQITALLEVVAQVAGKDIPEETATAVIMAAFPSIPRETIEAMLTPLRNFEPPKPEPLLGPDGQPIAPGAAAQTDLSADEGDGKQSKPSNDQPPPSDSTVDKAEKLAKARRHNRTITQQRKVLTVALKTALAKLGDEVARQVTEGRKETVQKQFSKSKDNQAMQVKRLIGKLDISFDSLEDELTAALEIVSKEGAIQGLKQFGKKVAVDAFDLANSRAEKYARARAAELIKSDGAGGELVDSTREMLRTTIVQAEENGWSNDKLAQELKDSYAFSKQRAETIARTELKTADSEGAIAGWRATGLKMKKEWVRSANDYDCDICEANEQQGPIDLDDSFDSGDDTSPAHPNCECAVLSVLDEEQEL